MQDPRILGSQLTATLGVGSRRAAGRGEAGSSHLVGGIMSLGLGHGRVGILTVVVS